MSSKDSSASGVTEDADTLSATTLVRFVDLIGQGPIKGLVNGERSIYFDGVPVQSETGSYNYKPASWSTRNGEADQDVLPGLGSVEEETQVEIKLTRAVPIVRTLLDTSADEVRVTVAVAGLSHTEANGHIKGTSVEYTVELKGAYTDWVIAHRGVIDGKSMARYPESVSIPLAAYGKGPFDIRVTRVTADSTSAMLVNDLYWTSFTSINYEKFSYPFRALAGFEIDARYFNSVPKRQYHVEGLLVEVPTNYDPVARTYAVEGPGTTNGAWDGTFKIAYTNNPAWCTRDILVNRRYGAGRRINVAHINKWEFYQIAMYCDDKVPTGLSTSISDILVGYDQRSPSVPVRVGAYEPRFTLNVALLTAEDAYKVLASLSSVFRGMVYWSSGAIVPTQDRPAKPKHVFTNASVTDGVFLREGSAASQRHTAALVGWNDPAEKFSQKFEYVEDRDGIARYGLNLTQVVSFGCTSRSQARRYGLGILITERLETEMISFEAPYSGARVNPGDVVAVRDSKRTGVRWGGRLLEGGLNQVKLDAPVNLTPGTYTLTAVCPSGLPESRQFTVTRAGGYQTIDLPVSFTEAPGEMAVWTLSSQALMNELLRVVGVKEVSPTHYRITAVTHDPDKYGAIDAGIPMTVKNYSVTKLQATPEITGLVLRENSYIPSKTSAMLINLDIGWDRSTSTQVRGYWVKVQGLLSGVVMDEEVSDSGLTLNGLDVDTYTVSVRSVSYFGAKGEAKTESIKLTGLDRTPPESVEKFSAEIHSGGVEFTWKACEDIGYDVTSLRVGPIYETSSPLFSGRAGNYLWPWPPVGTYVVWATHMDTSGNVSAPVNVSVTVTEADVITWSNLLGRPSDLSNLVMQGDFEGDYVGTWMDGYPSGAPLTLTPPGSIIGKAWSRALVLSAVRGIETGTRIPVVEGETIYVEADISTLTSSFAASAGLLCVTAAGAQTWRPVATLVPKSDWTRVKGQLTVPEGVVACYPGLASGQASPALFANIRVSRYQPGATVGAPFGTLVGGRPAEAVSLSSTNFDKRNDRLSDPVVDPVIPADGTAVDHTINTDGSANLSLEWQWAGKEGDIDGFLVLVRQSPSGAAYTWGEDRSSEVQHLLQPDCRALKVYGVAADQWYSWAVQAYRIVDPDVHASGRLASRLVHPTVAEENPYRPSASVAFMGDINGTIGGLAANQINVWNNLKDRPTNLVYLQGSEDINNEKLGQGVNLIPAQTDFTVSLDGWDLGSWITGKPVGMGSELTRWPSGDWVPAGGNALYFYQGERVTSSDTYIWGEATAGTDSVVVGVAYPSKVISVKPLSRYCVSAYVAAHRCHGQVHLEFQRADGTPASGGRFNATSSPALADGGKSLTNWIRLHAFGVAPEDAASCRIILVKLNTFTGYTNSYAWFHGPMVEPAGASQQKPSNYAPGVPTSARQLGYTGDLNATNGAPFGTVVGDMEAGAVGAAAGNFNRRNDRLATAIPSPSVVTDGTAVDHTGNVDGSVNLSFEWQWPWDESTIDGFLVLVRQGTSNTYNWGDSPAEEVQHVLRPDKRAIVLYGVAADKKYHFRVLAYRDVDPDVNTSGRIFSYPAVPSASTGEYPYQPSTQVVFNGNVRGTVNGIPVSQVNVWDSVSGRPQNLQYLDGSEEIRNGLIGSATNLLRCQTDFVDGNLAGWVWSPWTTTPEPLGMNTERARDPLAQWIPTGMNAIVCHQLSPAAGGDGVLVFGAYSLDLVAVEPNKRYCVSAWVANHRCDVGLHLEFKDANGNNLPEGGVSVTNSEHSGGTSLAGWKRLSVFRTAPAGATGVRILFAKYNTKAGQPDSFGWFSCPMIEPAGDQQAVPSAYVSGTPVKHSDLGLVRTEDVFAGAATDIYEFDIDEHYPQGSVYDPTGTLPSWSWAYKDPNNLLFDSDLAVPPGVRAVMRLSYKYKYTRTPPLDVIGTDVATVYGSALNLSVTRSNANGQQLPSLQSYDVSHEGMVGSVSVSRLLPQGLNSTGGGHLRIYGFATCLPGYAILLTNVNLTIEVLKL